MAIGAVLPGVQASIALLLVAFILDLVKRDDAAGHLAGVAFPLAHPQRAVGRRPVSAHGAAVVLLLFLPGWMAWLLISLWFLYRVVRGWLALNDRKPMPE